jgi:hypothetical protein
MKKALKISLITVLLLIIIVGAAGIIVPNILESKLKEALIAEFSEQTEQIYTLDLNHLNLSLWSRTISVDSLMITSDKDEADARLIKAASVSIEGVEWLSLGDQRFPKFESVTIEAPVAELYSRKITNETAQRAGEKLDIPDLAIFDVYINNGSGKIVEKNGKTVFSLESFTLTADDVNLNSLLTGGNVPFLNDLSLSGNKLYWNLEEHLYSFNIEEFAFNKLEQQGRINVLTFTPVVEKYRFSELNVTQTDRYDLTIDKISLDGLNLDRLTVPAIDINSIHIQSADLEVFHSKLVPKSQSIQFKPLLHEALGTLGFSFGVDTLSIADSRIRYGEHLPNAIGPGYISFNELSADLRNIWTHEHPKFGSDSLYLHVETKFMDTTPFSVDMSYATFDENESHRLDVHLQKLDADVLNQMLINTAFMEVERGVVNDMKMNLLLNRYEAGGVMLLNYENLHIEQRDRGDASNTNFKTRLKSFVANTFVMDSENSGDDVEPAIIELERPKDRAIFGYWWLAVKDGLMKTLK